MKINPGYYILQENSLPIAIIKYNDSEDDFRNAISTALFEFLTLDKGELVRIDTLTKVHELYPDMKVGTKIIREDEPEYKETYDLISTHLYE